MRLNMLFSKMIGLLVLLLFANAAVAASGTIRDVRLWTAPDHTRLVFDLSGKIEHKLTRLHNPERIVIDMQKTKLKADLKKLPIPDPVVKGIRHGISKEGTLRVVIDVKEKVQPRSFPLKRTQGKPPRLVVDLMRQSQAKKEAMTAGAAKKKKGLIIAIDAGHGGEDPGAVGPRKLYEKVVTLAVAKELAKIVNATPGMHAVLIRKGDYFVSLGKRVRLARKAKADLMISIHADAVRERSVKGASVYTLSDRGATQDKAARALAAKENAADEVGGVAFDQIDDPVVNSILGNMLRTDSINSSQILAETVIGKLKRAGPIKYSKPKRARFAVLSAMEIPSVLVELDYISNPVREKKLRTRKHQKLLASTLFDASVDFFRKMGRLNTTQQKASDTADSMLADNNQLIIEML
ncbi:N-acetylmuramoyl-L-alanine amidase [Mariprofundus micogutta]|uniref:N-acetylmuramoyl-L-alanine amidase n=1 Tax=Mariprofundus micogutta TaxID=1921010 RepID=A0A1L8CLM0_9PROT|nr:N-acetylmuramoyl-L-alanine amidase [Mariprofundus micogutta]GAV19785.1 N-acetylmuramoyl-L-alanine amidase [Mariprofundus micogutta]